MALITLVERVERSMRLLKSVGLNPGCSPEDMATDLLADLRHLCDWAELDFEVISDRSLMHYEAEIDELESTLAKDDGHEPA
jgi:hypothetical protein